MVIARYPDMNEAILRANDSTYGLGTVVLGGKKAQDTADQMEAGMVGMNEALGAGAVRE